MRDCVKVILISLYVSKTTYYYNYLHLLSLVKQSGWWVDAFNNFVNTVYMSRVEVSENVKTLLNLLLYVCEVILDLAGLTGFWVDVLGLEMK